MALIVLSPTVWVDILEQPERHRPAAQPGHRLDAGGLSRRRARVAPVEPEARAESLFDTEKLRVYLGVGAE